MLIRSVLFTLSIFSISTMVVVAMEKELTPNEELFRIIVPGKDESDIIEKIQSLIAADADVNAYDEDRISPLHCAASCGYMNICELLIKVGAKINLRAPEVENGNDKVSDYIEFSPWAGMTPLHLAVESNRQQVVEFLLKHKVNVEIGDREKNTALLLACMKGYESLIHLLLKNGAHATVCNKLGWTPLHRAIQRHQHAETIEALLAAGADPNALNNSGNTPLSIAAALLEPTLRPLEIIELLIYYGANPMIISDSRNIAQSPDAAETAKKEIAYLQIMRNSIKFRLNNVFRDSLLIDTVYGCSPEVENIFDQQTLHGSIAPALQKTAEIALAIAAGQGHSAIVLHLLSRGVRPSGALVARITLIAQRDGPRQEEYERVLNLLIHYHTAHANQVLSLNPQPNLQGANAVSSNLVVPSAT